MLSMYELNRVYNNNAFLNFILGIRSIGKSFDINVKMLQQVLRRDGKFFYIRRKEQEIELFNADCFGQVLHRFPGYNVRVETGKMINRYYLYGDDMQGILCGYSTILSRVQGIKSADLSDVTLIVFDEFLPENNRYQHPTEPFYEPMALSSLITTINRGRDKDNNALVHRDNLKVILLGNYISSYNPYFTFFGVDLKKGVERENAKEKYLAYKSADGTIYAEVVELKEVQDTVRKSPWGKIMASTPYGAYSIDNVSMYDNEDNIVDKMPAGVVKYLQYYYFGEWYSIYKTQFKKLFFYITKEKRDVSFTRAYKLSEGCPEDLPWLTGVVYKDLKLAADYSRLYYVTGDTKAKFAGIFLKKRGVS